MLDTEPTGPDRGTAAEGTSTTTGTTADTTAPRPRRRAASRAAGPPPATTERPEAPPPSPDAATDAVAEKPTRPRRTRKAAATAEPSEPPAAPEPAVHEPAVPEPAAPAAKRTRRTTKKAQPEPERPPADEPAAESAVPPDVAPVPVFAPPVVLFQPPEPSEPREPAEPGEPTGASVATEGPEDEEGEEGDGRRRRRRRGGRGRRRSAEGADTGDEDAAEEATSPETAEAASEEPADEEEGPSARRRRRRRRRSAEADGDDSRSDDPPHTVVHLREARSRADRDADAGDDRVQSPRGSTRLEAKKQRRREGRDQGRRRPPVISEAEFLARRESVERVMVVRQHGQRTQIAVLEDGVLVEHYVDRHTSASYVGNVYLGRVQNVLPSMEAAFVDIGKGRNAVLYAGEVNWDAAGLDGQPKRIEQALKSGQSVLAQVTKDPIGHKGARLTSQVSLPGRYLVYVPDGSMTGISRKLPDNERSRLKSVLRKVVPDSAGVIVRTAAEGASEEELAADVRRLEAQWESIRAKAQTASAPALLYGEPDLTIRVIRDVFNEDFSRLVVAGDEAWETVEQYVGYVAPDLAPRLEKWTGADDVWSSFRIDEQLMKALDRKVWLPSGGSLVIDRTEAMTVVDVNTGKFTGKGGNLEETVTKNNLEAAEEIVRQLRLRDIGGIIVVDFIDMVLESNRELVLRRLLECLGRDRTKHQVAEVTSLGLVQMTRKRVGQGLLEAFSETCETCHGRGLIVHMEPVESPPRPPARRGRADREAEPALEPEPRSPEEPTSVTEVLEPEVEAVAVAHAVEPAKPKRAARSRKKAAAPAPEPVAVD